MSETEEKFDNPEYAEFSGGNDAEVVSEFSDDSVPAAQTGGNNVVYLIRGQEMIQMMEAV